MDVTEATIDDINTMLSRTNNAKVKKSQKFKIMPVKINETSKIGFVFRFVL